MEMFTLHIFITILTFFSTAPFIFSFESPSRGRLYYSQKAALSMVKGDNLSENVRVKLKVEAAKPFRRFKQFVFGGKIPICNRYNHDFSLLYFTYF